MTLVKLESINKQWYFYAFFLIFFSILMVHNPHLFTKEIFEDSDFAANSILINLAKYFQLFVGNYSRMGFNHPGPAFLYVQAFFEALLFDLFHLVPTPVNAHIISIMFLNSFLLAISCYILLDLLKSFTKVFSIVALLLYYFTINPSFLNSTWMPYAYFIPFFTFILSATAISSKRTFFLWSLILTGSILMHGHVSLILITVPVMIISLLLCISNYQYDVRTFYKENRLVIFVSSGLILLFALPILINIIINYPGEFGKYLQYSSNRVQQTPDIKSVILFFLPFWIIGNIGVVDASNGLIYFLFLTASIVIIFYFQKNGEVKIFIKNFMIIGITVSSTFLLYIIKGIDELNKVNHYTGYFFYAIPLIISVIILTRLMEQIPDDKSKYLLISTIIIMVFLASSGGFKSTYQGSPYIKDIIFKLQSDSRWKNETVILDFPHDSWPKATAIVIALERQGKHPYLSNPFWEFMFTKRYISTFNNQNISKEWNIYIDPEKGAVGNFSNIIFSNQQITLIDKNEK